MSKNSHAKHEHNEHAHDHHESDLTAPTYGQKHKKLIWAVVIFLIVAGPLIMAAYSVSRALFH
jgi:hypothetical protein